MHKNQYVSSKCTVIEFVCQCFECGSNLLQTSWIMSQLSLRTTLTVLFWNNVCSQLLYEENNQWNKGLIRDSKDTSQRPSQERLEALLKRMKLESEIWRTRYETLSESYDKLPTACKERVHNGMSVKQLFSEV